MSINSLLGFITEIFFPLKESSAYFNKWTIDDFQNKIPPAKNTDIMSRSLFSYRDKNTRLLIRSLKNERSEHIGKILAKLLSDEVLSFFEEEMISEKTNIYIVPIPIGRKRMEERGFNQCLWIAKMLCDELGGNFVCAPYMLKKIKDTKKQALLHKSDRLKNPIGSFQSKKVPKGSTIIIFDDVITTGATTNEAGKVLRKFGARKIYTLSIAR